MECKENPLLANASEDVIIPLVMGLVSAMLLSERGSL